MSLLAIDIGSSACKGIAFSEDGKPLAQRTYAYFPETPRPLWAEMPVDTFWKALCTVLQGITRDLGNETVRAMCISSHGETFVATDSEDRPLGPAILNMDNRSSNQAKWLADAIGRRRLFGITGHVEHSMYPMPKILWLKEHDPERFKSTKCFAALTSFLLMRLNLPPYVDYSHAARFLGFDISLRQWSMEILDVCGITPEQLPIPVPAGTLAGELGSRAAEELGLPKGTLVIVGGHDQACGALGVGAIDEGRVSASLGSYECLTVASDSPVLNDAAYSVNLNTYNHVVPNRFVTLAYFPAGIMLEWLRHLLAENPENARSGDLFSRLEREAPADPTGLVVLPHVLGTCTPDFDASAFGTILGIRPSTSPAKLYKGILEGIACEFAIAAQNLQQALGSLREIYVSGGGCNSLLGLQLRAAITGRRLHRMKCSEAVCLGTAILAGVGAGIYPGYKEAADELVSDEDIIASDPALIDSYRCLPEEYRMAYSCLAPLRRSHKESFV